jgi:major type 1 subunit fimbrin (pilin)
VQVLDKDHQVININTDDATSRWLVRCLSGSTPVNLQYYVQYYSQAGGAGAGDVTATANFQLTYE